MESPGMKEKTEMPAVCSQDNGTCNSCISLSKKTGKKLYSMHM